jgi:hypothetical protein
MMTGVARLCGHKFLVWFTQYRGLIVLVRLFFSCINSTSSTLNNIYIKTNTPKRTNSEMVASYLRLYPSIFLETENFKIIGQDKFLVQD